MSDNSFGSIRMAYFYIVSGILGFAFSFILTLEKIALMLDPQHVASCSISPFLSCNSVIDSSQASVFGFPNPLLGIAGFSFVIAIGFAMIAGAQFKKWFWYCVQFGFTLATIFVFWLIHESLYDIGSLCIYCMLTWATTLPLFVYTLKYIVSFNTKRFRFAWMLLVLLYILIITMILLRFWDYWISLLR